MNIPNPYTLPPMDFVGGSTQDLFFYCYFYRNRRPHDLSSCTANFAIINFVNKNGEPLVSKPMEIRASDRTGEEANNVLRVTLNPSDTVNLPAGKYIYQISIRHISGDMEIPKQGIIHIINNINKSFVQ